MKAAMSTDVVEVHELRGRDVLRDFEHAALPRGMKLVVAVWKEQNARTYRPRGGGEITIERLTPADVMALDRPASINPIARLKAVGEDVDICCIGGEHFVATGEGRLIAGSGGAEDALNLETNG